MYSNFYNIAVCYLAFSILGYGLGVGRRGYWGTLVLAKTRPFASKKCLHLATTIWIQLQICQPALFHHVCASYQTEGIATKV